MIIACPECTSPFQVVDGQIAALVQVECPTCSFRMILDFEAANDASLIEDGMQMTQGFRDEAAYRQAVGGGITYDSAPADTPTRPDLRAVPEPELEPELEPEPEPTPVAQPTPTPVVARPTPTPVVQPTPTPVARPEPQPTPTPTPVARPEPVVEPTLQPAAQSKPPIRNRPRPKPTLIAQTAPPPVQPRIPPQQPPRDPSPVLSEARIETHVGRAPERPEEPTQPPVDDFNTGFESEDIDIDLEPEVEAAPRRPAHTPEQRPHGRDGVPDGVPKVDTTPPPLDLEDVDKPTTKHEAKPQPDANQGGGVVRNILGLLLLLILLAITGLAVWSLIEYQNPDPRQLIQDKFGVDLGPLAPPPAEAKADPTSGDDPSNGSADED